MHKKTTLVLLCCATLFLGIAQHSDAATMRIQRNGTFDVRTGGSVVITLVVDTDKDYINAAEAKIVFANSVLKLEKVDKTNSIFNFWLKEPTISNTDGTLEFTGGTARGVSGKSLQILKLYFTVIGTGVSDVRIENAVVSASDGKGTNVLSTIENMRIDNSTVGSNQVTFSGNTEVQPTELPKEIVRTPIIGSALPEEPKVRVNLYPDQSLWYNHLANTVALWDLPDDIVKIAVAIDHSPYTEPKLSEPTLTDGKDFGALGDGIWYIHVQFRNNKGWGPVAHYKIAIDTKPPLPFMLDVKQKSEEDPTPQIFYHTHDSLSGMSHAEIYVDGEPKATDTAAEGEHLESSTVLSPLAPGHHTISAQLFDRAGNSVEDSVEIDVLPIETPIIRFYPSAFYLDGSEVVWGHALPRAQITLHLLSLKGKEMYAKTVGSSSEGHWMVNVDAVLPQGEYLLEASAQDESGAMSYPTDPVEIRVRGKSSILTVGNYDFSLLEVVLIIALLTCFSLEFVPMDRKEQIFNRLFNRKKKRK